MGLKELLARLAGAPRVQAAAKHVAVLDEYVRVAPTPQNAVNLFHGEWWSRLPQPPGLVTGNFPLFDDDRLRWAIEALGGVAGRSVLELGQLEGGHSYMLEQAGAQSILEIEGNTRAFLKCLVAKEVVGLPRTRFALGDFEAYLRGDAPRVDVVIASGVLYHVHNPVELIHNIARISDHVYIWTHFFDKERIEKIAHMRHRFASDGLPAQHAGLQHTLYHYNYGDFLETGRFAGGSQDFSHWLSQEDLMRALRHAGLTDITVGLVELEHTNGPTIRLVASRPGA